ncbi:MAG: hypothetical protein EGQ09_20200 [Clostridiales bacterium]|nr:hypothetical protein [Clostridiales bacterium]MBD9199320.1 hypothetical protein [Clostridiales bacterium]
MLGQVYHISHKYGIPILIFFRKQATPGHQSGTPSTPGLLPAWNKQSRTWLPGERGGGRPGGRRPGGGLQTGRSAPLAAVPGCGGDRGFAGCPASMVPNAPAPPPDCGAPPGRRCPAGPSAAGKTGGGYTGGRFPVPERQCGASPSLPPPRHTTAPPVWGRRRQKPYTGLPA